MKRSSAKEPAADFDIFDVPSVAERKTKTTPDNIPEAVIRRLPRYFRCLRDLYNRDILRVSSAELSEYMDITASQLRQDMKYLDAGGQRGYGYTVKTLYTSVSGLLGVSKKHTAVMAGAGHLGRAIASSMILEQRGVWLKGVFDRDENVCGAEFAGLTVEHIGKMKDFCRENNIDILIICCDPGSLEAAEKTAAEAGVKGVWNFSQYEIRASKTGVPVENVCTGDSLMNLIYEMSGKK